MAQTRSEKLREQMKEKGLKLPHGYQVTVRKKKPTKKAKK